MIAVSVCIIPVMLALTPVSQSPESRAGGISVRADELPDSLIRWIDWTFRAITRQELTGEYAKNAFRSCRRILQSIRQSHVSKNDTSGSWVFPLEGRTCSAIGGKGKGYRGASAYDFFEGNMHRGHPAHDIFILDRNYDSKDDRNGKPVHVLSATSGVVLSVTPEWTKDSTDVNDAVLRGGANIWVYDPEEQSLHYYAHLSRVHVRAGKVVRAGEKIGVVGRTGKNAVPKRSSTHLHYMYLSLGKGVPVPVDPYTYLCSARSKRR